MTKNKYFDIAGQKFNRLTAIKKTKKTAKGSYYWECLCDCGNYTEVPVSFIIKNITRSCGCLQKEFIKKQIIKNRKPSGEADRNALYRKYRSKSKIRGLAFDLNIFEFTKITTSNCHYCGIPPMQRTKRPKQMYFGDYVHNGIDRLNNNIGYVPDNCVPCCKECNFAKNTMSHTSFIAWIERVFEYRKNLK